jgi:hypothetical protein
MHYYVDCYDRMRIVHDSTDGRLLAARGLAVIMI